MLQVLIYFILYVMIGIFFAGIIHERPRDQSFIPVVFAWPFVLILFIVAIMIGVADFIYRFGSWLGNSKD